MGCGESLTVKKNRPVNLRLTTIRFPCTAIVSILHRASGVILFLFIPLLLWLLEKSLHSAADFAAISECFASPVSKLFLLGLVAALSFHLIAGIRHLLMDIGVGESKCAGTMSAILVFILSIIVIGLLGVWLW